MSVLSDKFTRMFGSIELPPPEAIGGLDDFGLLDTMELATTLETVAIDVQIAVIRELCRRQGHPAAGTGPPPPRSYVHTAAPPPTQSAKAAEASSLTQAEQVNWIATASRVCA